jgi:hypothetical protein
MTRVDLEALTGHTPGPYVRYEPEDGIGCYWVEHLPEGSVAYETKNGVAAFGQAVFAVPIFNGRETANLLAAAPDLLAEVRALRAERDALQRFKDFVHRRLDTAGVPTHPDGPHSKEGCRIGDRLDLVVAERDALRLAYDAKDAVDAAWSDARAGMVPAAELHGDRGDGHCQACIGRSVKAESELAKAHAGMDLFEKRLQHEVDSREAELAKAWEAGKEEAWRAMVTCNDKTHAEELRAISKLQPPGGKAK